MHESTVVHNARGFPADDTLFEKLVFSYVRIASPDIFNRVRKPSSGWVEGYKENKRRHFQLTKLEYGWKVYLCFPRDIGSPIWRKNWKFIGCIVLSPKSPNSFIVDKRYESKAFSTREKATRCLYNNYIIDCI